MLKLIASLAVVATMSSAATYFAVRTSVEVTCPVPAADERPSLPVGPMVPMTGHTGF